MTIRRNAETFLMSWTNGRRIYLLNDRSSRGGLFDSHPKLLKVIGYFDDNEHFFRFEQLYQWHDLGIYSKNGNRYLLSATYEKYFPSLKIL